MIVLQAQIPDQLEIQQTLCSKLQGAVEALVTGALSQQQFLEALEFELQNVENAQASLSGSDLEEPVVEALNLYLDCLLQLEQRLLADEELNSFTLAELYQQADEADRWLDELTEPDATLDPGLEL